MGQPHTLETRLRLRGWTTSFRRSGCCSASTDCEKPGSTCARPCQGGAHQRNKFSAGHRTPPSLKQSWKLSRLPSYLEENGSSKGLYGKYVPLPLPSGFRDPHGAGRMAWTRPGPPVHFSRWSSVDFSRWISRPGRGKRETRRQDQTSDADANAW